MARLKGKKVTASDASPTTGAVAAVKDAELAESNDDETATAITASKVEPSKEGNPNDVQVGIAEESEIKGPTEDGVVEAKETDKTTVIAVSESETTETANTVADSADTPANEECMEKVAKVVQMEATVTTIVANVVTDGVEKKDAKEGIIQEKKTDSTEAEKVEVMDTKVEAKNMKRAFKKKVKRLRKKKRPVAGGAAKDSADKSKTAAVVGSTYGTKTEDGCVGEENQEGVAKAENDLNSEDRKVIEVGVEEEVKAYVDLGNASTKKSKKIKKKKRPVSGVPNIGAATSNDANDANKSKTHDEATDDASPVKDEDKQGASPSKKKDLKKKEGMGLVFMCSSKTKKDCYKYKLFGMPESKREIVDKVGKGMRLFLFDIDLRLMYGIYKAASPGGYNILPKAFKSAFPCQVRFSVLNDCKPLPEEKFKAVIKANYYTRNKFNCQLSAEQVKNLCKLFQKENGPSKLIQARRRAAGAAKVRSPDRGTKRTRLVISANDIDSGRRVVESRRDSKVRRRLHPTEANRLPTEGHRDLERKRRRNVEDPRDSVHKRPRTEGRRDSEHKRMHYSDDTRDSQYPGLHVEDTRAKEYRRPRDKYERERYQSPPPPRQVALPPGLPPSYTYERPNERPAVVYETPYERPAVVYETPYERPAVVYERPYERPAVVYERPYERPAVADEHYYKKEPPVELRDPHVSYRESIGYRYAYTSSYRDPAAYQETAYASSLPSASYVAGYPSGSSSSAVYAPGSSSAVYAPGSASAVYGPRSVSAVYAPGSASTVYAPVSASTVYAPGSASAVYAPGSVSAAYPERSPLYRY